MDTNAFGDSPQGNAMARAMAQQADAVGTSLRNALLAVEEAKTAATDTAACDSFDEDENEIVDVESSGVHDTKG